MLKSANVFLENVDENYLHGKACPLVALKRFEDIIDIVDDSGRQNACLIEDLRKMCL